MHTWISRRFVTTAARLSLTASLFAAVGCADGPPEPAPGATLGSSAQGVVCVTLRRLGPAPGGAEDAVIAFDPTDPTRAGASNGGSTTLSVGTTGTVLRQGLLRFDLSSIPANVPITSATLSLRKALSLGAGPVEVHRATASWAEGSVTWNGFGQAVDPVVHGTILPANIVSNGLATVDVTALMQGWSSGTFANHGFVLDEPSGGRTVFGSSEANGPSRPQLSVCFTLPTCSDGLQNGGELDVDCGGSCAPCSNLCLGVVCSASDACHAPGTCDPSTGVCSNPPIADGTACDDADACTQNDSCQSGSCVATPVVCPAPTDCQLAGACNTATGQCDYAPVPDGTPCVAACGQGTCAGGSCSTNPGVETCSGYDEDCDGLVDEGCDDDGDGFCDSAMVVVNTQACPATGNGPNCTATVGAPTYIGNVVNMDTHSHGGGYSPLHHEYWYPEWAGGTVYRYDASYQLLGTFQSQADAIMQLWGDTDGSYYTANWSHGTISKHQGLGGPLVWSTNIGGLASGVASDAAAVWAMDHSSMTLWQLDKGTGAVVATFPLSGGSGAGLYGGLAVYGGKLYRGTSSASVDVYDLATKQYESTFYVATAIYNMAFNGQDYCISSNSSSVYCYTLPSVSCSAGDDCDDTNGSLHPTGLPEVCDGTDDNCNTGVDEGCDDDGDGYCDAALGFSGSAPVCPLGGNDCDDSDPSLSPTGAPEATCDGLDENCNGAVDEGCDDDGDGYCDTSMAVGDTAACPGTGSGPNCAQVSTTPTYIGNVVNMDTQSHGGGYSPFAHEYWYPVWSGGTVYRYDESYQFLGTFQSQASQIMQLWGDTDGSYYTANYSYNTISKHQGMGGPLVWTTNLGTTAGGVTADASYVWAMDVSSSTLWQLDKANGSILATHTLGGTLGGSLLGGLATVGGKLYRGDDGGVVNVFNLGTMLWESSFNVATPVYNMAFNGEEYCVSANSSSVYCYAIATTVCTTGDDCDDGDPTKHPTAIEACDGVDQSCEGTVDEGCDDDGDGFCDGNLAFAGSPSICPQGGGDCDDSNAALSPTGLPETSCDGIDENCNLAIDEGCDDDGDGYCDPAMAVGNVSACPNTGYGPGCVGTGAPTFIGNVINMDTQSHGGGFSPYHHEYWYPSWGSNTVYRYDLSYQFLGTFTSGTSYMMQLWGDTDGSFYTADWGNATITKYQGMGGAALWSTSIGATASAVTADANYVWAMDYYSLQLRQLDKATGALLNTFTLPSGGSSDTYGGLAVHGGKLYRGGSAGVVDVYNLQTKQYLASFNVATSIYNMAFNGQEYCISANSSSVYCYTLPTVSCPSGDDCNDNDASLHPTNQAEACDDVDNNCNAAVDEGCDADGDGFCNNNMAIVGTPAVCVNGLGDCDDSNAALAPTGLPETTCDAADENCNGTADEGCDDDGDGFCDAGMAVTDTSVCPNTGGGANCSAVPGTPTYIGQVVNMDTRSHGGGYSPFYEEYWYPEWSGSTVYRYNESYQLVGTFSSGASQIMQLWGDTDGSYYTANWGYGTIAKHQGPGGPVLWSTYIGTTASGVTADADHVWAMDPSSSTLWQLDKSTGAIVGTHYLTGTLGTTMYGGLVALGGKLYRGDAGAVVNVFDLTTKQWESSFNVATSVYNMAFNGEDYCLSANSSSVYCYTIATHVCTTGDDCDDGSGAVSPGAVESCDGADQTCDGTIDEGCDDDGDGFCDGSLGFSGSPPICPAGGSDCNDDDATKVPTGVAETVCDGVDENCNSVVDEGCDDDGDGYCDSAMAVLGTSACPNTGAGANCTGVGSPTFIGNVITMDTQSHGGGYSPFHHEYWYPGWSGSTVYRYDANYQFLGTFQSQASQIMQLWGDTDGTYYTANWGAATISKHQGMGGPIVWTTSIGATASAVTADAHHVWAMDYYSLTLRQLDKTTGTLLATFSLPSGGSSDTYGGLAVYSGKLYRGGSAGVVDVYDLATKQYLSSFNVATSVYNMAFNGHDYCISANSSSVYCYTLPLLSCTSGDDCNDASAAVSPGAPEVCDGLDQTCEGTIDEGCDDDGDGFCDGALGFSGSPPICPGGAGDCDDDDALLSPTGVPETACDGIDENCNSVADEGCDDDGDGYCDSGMSIVDPTLCPNTALGPNCAGSGQPPTFIGSVINMDTRSHGGGYSPLADEYWYPEWAGSTVYRYDTNYQLLGTFQSGSSQIMQLWGESDGTYYTANWGYATITKHQGANGPVLWSTNIGTTASAVTTDGSYVWAMDPSSATLWQLDKNNGAILATHQLSGGQMGTLYGALAAVSGKLYRGNTSGVVDVYDLGSKQWESSFNTGTNIYNMAWNGQDYCVSANSSAVYCYSLSVLVCTVGDDCNDMSSAVGGGC